MSKVIVIGGGPAGCFSAISAARAGHQVTLLEKNEKIGKKLYITGKGRCNITNASDMDVIFQNVMSNRKFLYSAFYTLDNQQVIQFFEENGCATKIERGNRVFPVSDHSSDVIVCLNRAMRALRVKVMLHHEVSKLLTETTETGTVVKGVVLKDGTAMQADAVIVATGGFSYQSTGSTGDGYQFAKDSGHRMVEVSPSLVPFEVKEAWAKELMGLSLKNTAISIFHGKKKIYDDFGEMLFTHFGVSGPMILSASGTIAPKYFKDELICYIDLKPAMSEEELDKRVLRDFEEAKNKQFKNSVQKLFPSKMVSVMIMLSGIDPDKKVNEISKEERLQFVRLIKQLPLTIIGLRDFKEAIITKGGVSVKDVNPSTMESKICQNLYFCGEVLDLDALTGGYNLQIAWSTGYLAGINIR